MKSTISAPAKQTTGSSVSPALGMSEAGLHVARHQVQLGKVSDCASHRHVNMDSKGIKDI